MTIPELVKSIKLHASDSQSSLSLSLRQAAIISRFANTSQYNVATLALIKLCYKLQFISLAKVTTKRSFAILHDTRKNVRTIFVEAIYKAMVDIGCTTSAARHSWCCKRICMLLQCMASCLLQIKTWLSSSPCSWRIMDPSASLLQRQHDCDIYVGVGVYFLKLRHCMMRLYCASYAGKFSEAVLCWSKERKLNSHLVSRDHITELLNFRGGQWHVAGLQILLQILESLGSCKASPQIAIFAVLELKDHNQKEVYHKWFWTHSLPRSRGRTRTLNLSNEMADVNGGRVIIYYSKYSMTPCP